MTVLDDENAQPYYSDKFYEKKNLNETSAKWRW